jgi:uncharacterized protein
MLSYNVGDLLRAAPGTSERHDVAIATLTMADGVELVDAIVGEVCLTSTGRSILVQGQVHTVLAEQCSRCLRPAKAVLGVQFEEEALPSFDLESGGPLATDAEPDVLMLDDHHELDLEPVVRDAISLGEPIAPLCRPECPGLCASCGIDLTDEPGHSHPGEDIDPRLAALVGIRDQLKSSKKEKR